MEIKIHVSQATPVAEVISEGRVINTVQDALDLMADVSYNGAHKVIVKKHHLHPDFFELRTQLAGEILQKFTNYRVQLAIIGDFDQIESKSLHDFIYESNKRGQIVFVSNMEEAITKLKN